MSFLCIHLSSPREGMLEKIGKDLKAVQKTLAQVEKHIKEKPAVVSKPAPISSMNPQELAMLKASLAKQESSTAAIRDSLASLQATSTKASSRSSGTSNDADIVAILEANQAAAALAADKAAERLERVTDTNSARMERMNTAALGAMVQAVQAMNKPSVQSLQPVNQAQKHLLVVSEDDLEILNAMKKRRSEPLE